MKLRSALQRALCLAAVAALIWSTRVASGRADDATDAARLFEILQLEPGMTLGEIGAGGGGMTIQMAKRLGPTGRVYSNELNPTRVEDIQRAVAREQLENVTVIQSSDASANLPDACCDAIFMRDVYHHFTKPAEMVASLVRALKPGGRLVVIDFEPGGRRSNQVPAGVPANRGGHGIRPDLIREELTAAGLEWTRTEPNWTSDLFLVLFRKPPA